MKSWQQRSYRISAMALCIVFSLILHLLLALLLILTGGVQRTHRPGQAAAETATRYVQIQRSGTQQQTPADSPEKQEKKPFAKTSADTLQALPDKPDYEGSRNTRATGAPDAESRRSDEAAPAQNGEEKDELVTFDQDRQDGDPEHETPVPATPPTPPQTEATEEGIPELIPPPAPGLDSASASTPNDAATDELDRSTTAIPSAAKPEKSPDGALLLTDDSEEENPPVDESASTAAARGTATGTGEAPVAPHRVRRPRPAFYDPSLATPQPGTIGFRTHERKTRSSGRFIMGKGAALNVTATPLGRYESEIYRRIAYFWYRACDEHRGDIIPGSITISLRINKRGQLENMDLVRRSGAGIIQQSFTFRAIRQATLPPMPTTVRQEIVGELLELLFTFNFD